jgi:hypothetical protein
MIDKEAQLYPAERLLAWKAEHEAWVLGVTEPVRQAVPWTMIVQDEDGRIDVDEAKEALGAGKQVAAVEEIGMPLGKQGWAEAARRQGQRIEEILANTPPERRRFAVFSMTRIPLAVQLGYLLSDRAHSQCYHYHRERGSWSWLTGGEEGKLGITRVWRRLRKGGGPVCVRVSLSARVEFDDVARVLTPAVDVEIAAEKQTVYWLRREDQLRQLAQVYERTLREIRERTVTNSIHLFYAGPTAGAVCFGQAYNPRMNPPLQLYEYRRAHRRSYEPVLLLNGSRT